MAVSKFSNNCVWELSRFQTDNRLIPIPESEEELVKSYLNRHLKIGMGCFCAGILTPWMYRQFSKRFSITKAEPIPAFSRRNFSEVSFLLNALSWTTFYGLIFARNDGLAHFAKADLTSDTYSNFVWSNFLREPSSQTLCITQPGRVVRKFLEKKIFFLYLS